MHDQRVDAGLAAHRVVGALGGDDGAVDVDVVASRAAQPGHRPGVLDGDLVWGEHGAAQLRHSVDDAFDAVAEDHVGVLAPAGEAPATGDPVAAVDRNDRCGRVEHAGGDGVGVGGVRARRRSPGEDGRGRSTIRHRSSPSRRPMRRPGPATRGRASRRAIDASRPPCVAGRTSRKQPAARSWSSRSARHSAAGLDLACSVEDRRRQLADGAGAPSRRSSCRG